MRLEKSWERLTTTLGPWEECQANLCFLTIRCSPILCALTFVFCSGFCYTNFPACLWSEDTEYMHTPSRHIFVLCITVVTEASASCPGEQLGSQVLQKASPEVVGENSSSDIPSGQGESRPWAEAGMCRVLQGRIFVAEGPGISPKARWEPRSV